MKLLVLWLAGFFLTTTVFAHGNVRSFTVDYSQDTFLKDGQPYSFVSGALHYFRIPRAYWRDRLVKMRAAGVDNLNTYINWALHEPRPGHFDFTGQLDFIEFFRIARQLNFTIVCRPGPYIAAEWDLGGYPAWLLTINPNIALRTSDPDHIFFVKKWFDVLMPRVVPLLYGNGGNIIMVQVENEYGWSQVVDKQYLKWLYDLLRSFVRDAAVLFTDDQVTGDVFRNGSLPGVLVALNIGPVESPMDTFSILREYQIHGPLVVMEYYVGFFTYWAQDLILVRTQSVVSNIEIFLQNNISFSMYMFHGGTSFAFSTGSSSSLDYVITSYDFDAPISEAGDLTPKYTAIRDTIKKYREVGDLPEPMEKGDYGVLQLQPVCSLFSCPIGIKYPPVRWPVTFEALGQMVGFLSYSATLDSTTSEPSTLQATVMDRTIVYLDDKEVGLMQSGLVSDLLLPSSNDSSRSLRLFVENMGRQEIPYVNLTRGLLSNATVDGKLVSNWKITGYPLYPEDITKLNSITFDKKNFSFPAVFRGSFTLGKGETPLDTFLSMEDWEKGVAFVNDHNIGRYWKVGPQVTLYVPATFLRAHPAPNIVTIVELHRTHPKRTITFLQNPIFKGNSSYMFA